MSIVLQIIAVASSLSFLVFVLALVSRGYLKLKYSLLWIALSCSCLIGALFPKLVSALASAIGFLTPSNFVFFFCSFFLLAICLSISGIISKQAQSIVELTQEVALLKSQIDRK